MPKTYNDRVRETTTTTGTGNLTLAGATTGMVSFSAGIGASNKCYYQITLGTDWEIGIGTLLNSTTLERTTVLASSSGGSAVNWPAGTKNVIATAAANFLTTYRGATDIILTAGEALAVRDCVFVSVINGKVYKTKADVPEKGINAWIVGFTTESAAADGLVTVRNVGILDGFSGLTAGRIQYLSETAGAITETAPANVVQVGIAVSSTEVLINSQGDRADPGYISGQKGYFAGGFTGANSALTDKLTFSNNTTAAQTTANLSQARSDPTGCSEGSFKGYVLGGYTGSVIMVSTADRITFSSETTAAVASAQLSLARQTAGGASNRLVKGYIAGGIWGYGTGSDITSIADTLMFGTETTSAKASANLSQARGEIGACSEGSVKCYFAGGTSSAYTNLTDMTTFAGDTTVAKTTANLATHKGSLAGCSNGIEKGYLSGGSGWAGFPLDTTDKITFSTDVTAAQTTANLSQARRRLAGLSEGTTKGFMVGGGIVGGQATTADRINYANDTRTATTSANLSQARASLAGFSDIAL